MTYIWAEHCIETTKISCRKLFCTSIAYVLRADSNNVSNRSILLKLDPAAVFFIVNKFQCSRSTHFRLILGMTFPESDQMFVRIPGGIKENVSMVCTGFWGNKRFMDNLKSFKSDKTHQSSCTTKKKFVGYSQNSYFYIPNI